MWTAFIKAGAGFAVLTFMMWLLVTILDPIMGFAAAGPHADAESVVRIKSYFDAMTLDNLTLLGGLATGIYLLGRSAVERQLGR